MEFEKKLRIITVYQWDVVDPDVAAVREEPHQQRASMTSHVKKGSTDPTLSPYQF